MSKMNYRGRGNDVLNTPHHDVDTFDHYQGPLGGDIRQSIKGATVNNRDELGGQQVQKVKRGVHGPKLNKGTQGRSTY